MDDFTQKDVVRLAFKFQDALVAYAYTLIRDWPLAEDAVQEAYLVLMDKWEEYDPGLSLYHWVRQMVYYKVKELMRSRRREETVDDEELHELVRQAMDEGLDEQAAAGHRTMAMVLNDCMDKLAANALRVLTSYYWDNMSCERIAELTGRTANAVMLALSRTRKSLRDCMELGLQKAGIVP